MDCSCYRSSSCITRKRKLLSYKTCSECEEIESWRHIIDAEMSPHDDQDMAAGDDQEMAEDMVLDDKKETTKAAEDANEAWHPEDHGILKTRRYPEKDANEAYLEDANDIAWCRFDESKTPPEPDEEPEPEEVQDEQWPEDATDDDAGDQELIKEDDEEQSLGDDSSEVEESDEKSEGGFFDPDAWGPQ